ncbi:hypothetical protein M0812_29634 [Anaeramoeba flamelloides]|uniref:Uncharacterized protein n=1 Tax=Anaeramoeba flamelloides TaxID=1746091 RepID=A0AAV7Y2A4_9EUKA|nr:hypothetical protein M0812_29634 [Anaeramoeba flamelloides]
MTETKKETETKKNPQTIINLKTKTTKKNLEKQKHGLYLAKYFEQVNNLPKNRDTITIETTSSYNQEVITREDFQPNNHFIWLLHLSFCDHLPLVLTPDDIWLTLLQGFSIHINKHSAKYRSRFMQGAEKETIRVRHDGLVKGSTSSPWHEVFPMFSKELKSRIGEKNFGALVTSFSTTTPVIENAYTIMLMDIVKSYFDYRARTMCGIPEIRLEGTVEDWEDLYDRVATFEEYGLGWWVEKLRYVLKRIVQTIKSNGEGLEEFWESFYKWKSTSGGDRITGWVHCLFPYKNSQTRNPYCKNFDFEISLEPSIRNGLKRSDFPSGMSKVPFVWEYYNQEFEMDFYSGFTSLLQEEKDNGAIRTNIGWIVSHKLNSISQNLKKTRRNPKRTARKKY